MSVDLGNEWIKIAIVSPGKPMEIILNSDSQRKTPLSVSFRDGERFFGDASLVTATRFPDKSFDYLLDLVGKSRDHPLVHRHTSQFPYRKLLETENNTIILKHPDGMTFTPEEVLAMILEQAKGYAEAAAYPAATKISEIVITVPPFFSQSERRAILKACKLAGLHCLQLMNTNTAVALNYGIFRINDFNESTPSNVLFYDMGATSTIATIVSYQVVKSKESGFVEKTPTLTVKGVGFDRTLGGLEMQLRLRDFLAEKFSSSSGIKLEDVRKNKRALAKLFKESARVKKVLSANTEITAQVENVMNDKDLRVVVTRDEFLSLCSDLLGNRLIKPVEDALSSSGLQLSDIHHVILFGGNTRVPKVQEVLSTFLSGKELGKSINSDEAAALGAVYQAAFLSKGFKVKAFGVKDFNVYPIQVDFTRHLSKEEDGSSEGGVKHVTRTLFGRGNHFPQKKGLTFSKHTSDFEFDVKYGEVKGILPDGQHSILGSPNISHLTVKGVEDALSKHTDKTSKGVKAHFKLDESGVIRLEKVESTFEHQVEEVVGGEESFSETLVKLGNTINKLFGGQGTEGGGEEGNTTEETPSESVEGEIKTNATSTENKTTLNETLPVDETSIPVNASAGNTTKTTEIKTKVVKESLQVKTVYSDIPEEGSDLIQESKKKLQQLRRRDQEKLRRDSARNLLESFITEVKMKLSEDEEYLKVSTEEERQNVITSIAPVSEWLEYESTGAGIDDFESKLKEVTTAVKPIYERVVAAQKAAAEAERQRKLKEEKAKKRKKKTQSGDSRRTDQDRNRVTNNDNTCDWSERWYQVLHPVCPSSSSTSDKTEL